MDEARVQVDVAKQIIFDEYPEIKPNIQAELDWLDDILIRFERTQL